MTRSSTLLLLAAGSAHAQCLWTQVSPTGPLPAPRIDAAVAYDSLRARIVLFGGHTDGFPDIVFGDTWEWDGSTWTQLATSGPPARYRHIMAFHEQWGKTVLFGASSTDFKTWLWDGIQWTSLPNLNAVVPVDACAAYDSANQRLITFGGGGDTATRQLNPNGTWTTLPISAASAPPYRDSATMVYDSDRARIIMCGGRFNTQTLTDAWEFDGSGSGSWTQLAPAPGRRYGASMSYDPSRRRVILQGGSIVNAGFDLDDTWELDPVTQSWTPRTCEGPRWRFGACMVRDAARSSVLLFGGRTFSGFAFSTLNNDLWRYDGSAPDGMFVTQAPSNNNEVIPGEPASLTITVTNALSYQWFRNGVPLSNGGAISGAQSPTLTINPVSQADQSQYVVIVQGACGSISRAGFIVVTDPNCYANCDHSTIPPILNANDFQCFLNKFAAGDSYSNCDGSTIPPILNANDFQCYLNNYADGCN